MLSKAAMYALMARHAVAVGLDQIMVGGAYAESGWDTTKVGDNGASIGLFQLHAAGRGAGLSVAEREDPDVQMRVMLPVYRAQYAVFAAAGYTDADLAWRVCCWSERPFDFENAESAAAQGYRAGWQQAALAPTEPARPTSLDPRRIAYLAAIEQWFGRPYTWGGKTPDPGYDCSGLLTACAQAVGLPLGDPNYTPADGLRDYCDERPGEQVLPGDLLLFHSTYGNGGPDYATHCGVYEAPGAMLDTHEGPGVGRTDYRQAYWQAHWLGGIWRPRAYRDESAGEEDDPMRVAELESLVGVLRDAGRVAREEIEATLAVPRLPRAAREKLRYGALPAAQTIERGAADAVPE